MRKYKPFYPYTQLFFHVFRTISMNILPANGFLLIFALSKQSAKPQHGDEELGKTIHLWKASPDVVKLTS